MLFDMLMFTFPFKTIKLLFSYTVKTEVHSFFPLLPLPSTASEVSLPAQEHKFPTISTCTDQCMWTHTQMWRVVNSPVCQCCNWQSKQVFVRQWSTVWRGKTVISANLNASTQPLTEDTAFMLLIVMRMNQNSLYDHSSSMTEKKTPILQFSRGLYYQDTEHKLQTCATWNTARLPLLIKSIKD